VELPGTIGFDKHLGIRIGAKSMATRNEFFSELNVVIDLSIKDQGEALILARHRLRAATDVDDRKPPVAEADLIPLVRRLVQPVARAVRPTMTHQVGKADERLTIMTLRRLEDPSEYATHCDALLEDIR